MKKRKPETAKVDLKPLFAVLWRVSTTKWNPKGMRISAGP